MARCPRARCWWTWRHGRELATATLDYPHGVMDECLPDGTRLKPDWALQHPQDYLDTLSFTVNEVLRESGVDASDVVGMSIDFTACTMIAVDESGTPLCFKDEFKSNPHSYVKLWKHHAAQDEANRLNAIAEERGEDLPGPIRRKDLLGMDDTQNLAGAATRPRRYTTRPTASWRPRLGNHAADRRGSPQQLHRGLQGHVVQARRAIPPRTSLRRSTPGWRTWSRRSSPPTYTRSAPRRAR